MDGTARKTRLKYAATINDEALPEDTAPEFEMQYLDIGNVDSDGGIQGIATHRFEEAPSRARRIARNGDVIVSTVRTYLQAIAPIQSPPDNLIVSTGFAVVRPRRGRLSAEFCKFSLREPSFLAQVEMRSVGVSYPAINSSDLGDISIYLPTIERQDCIAAFLNTEVRRIDQLLIVKQLLLELLAEKRRALITHAVTRGLDPNAPLRDSGLPWLGHIPAHWKTAPLRFVASFLGGATPDKGNAEYWQGSIPWVSPKDMKRDEIGDAEDHVSEDALQDSVLQLIPIGSVLIVVRGMILAHSFPAAITTELVTINQDMKALRCAALLDPRFLQVVLQGLTRALIALTGESAHGTKKLDTDVLGKFDIPLPSRVEQSAIIAHVKCGIAKLDALTTATQGTITLLKERRAALIAAAVTGQLVFQEPTRTRTA